MADVTVSLTISIVTSSSVTGVKITGTTVALSIVAAMSPIAFRVTKATAALHALSTSSAVVAKITRASAALSAVASLSAVIASIASVAPTLSAVSYAAAEISKVLRTSKTCNVIGSISVEPYVESQHAIHLRSLGFTQGIATRIVSASTCLSGATTVIGSTEYTFSQAIDDSCRDITAKVKIYFDGIDQDPLVIEKDGLVNVVVFEEAKADSDSPLGLVSSNILDLCILNTNGIFAPTNVNSPYYGKLVPQVPIEVFAVVKVAEDQYVEIALGTFYSGDWNAPTSKIEASVTGVDKLYAIAQKEMPNVKTQRRTTIGKMFILLFDLLGITPEEYNIDANLNVPIDIAWLPQGTVGEALQWLAEAGLCVVYVDRLNIIQVKRLNFTGAHQFEVTDANQLIDSDIPTSYEKLYSKLIMNRFIPSLGLSEVVLDLPDITVPVGTTLLTGLTFSKGPLGVVEYASLTGTASAVIKIIKSTSWTVDLEIINTGTEELGTVKVYGKVINTTMAPMVYEDNAIKAIVGEKVFSVKNELIQNEAYAIEYAGYLFDLLTRLQGYIKLAIRGNPQIELGSVVAMTDNTNNIANVDFIVMRSDMSLAGGLEASVEGVVINGL